MDINSEKMIHIFNDCVKEQVILLVTKICEEENLNWVEIAEKYKLLDTTVRKEYKPKKKRELKIPPPIYRCEAISAEGEQCKRSKKDECNFCRRHKYKQTYGTIHNKKITNVIKEEIIQKNDSDSDIEIDCNGNIITLDNGQDVIYIPSTGYVYSYTDEPKLLGKLNSDLKTIDSIESTNPINSILN
tara:strand:- start:432 stop:992 length:561 start_codon:yes stop_codon:yes gene_type:complete